MSVGGECWWLTRGGVLTAAPPGELPLSLPLPVGCLQTIKAAEAGGYYERNKVEKVGGRSCLASGCALAGICQRVLSVQAVSC